MKIVQIFPGKIWGGAEQYVLDLGRELSARGHNVTYVSRNSTAVISNLKNEGIESQSLPFSWTIDFRTISRLADIIKDADVIHIHTVKFVPITVLAKIRSGSNARIVMTRHDAHRTPVNPLFRRFFRNLHKIIFVSDLTRQSWWGANKWFTQDKCVVIHNSIPQIQNKTDVESLRDKYNIPATTPLIIFSGRVRKSKGCGVIIDALSRLSDRKFAMIFLGACRPDTYAETLTKSAETGGIADRIHFYGFTPNARELMKQADIGVSPSVFRDPFLLSNIEFQQQGVPVITTDNGGQPEYITDGETGLLVKPNDPEGLAEAIDRLLTNPELRRQIGCNGLDYFNANLSYDKFTDRIIKVYSENG